MVERLLFALLGLVLLGLSFAQRQQYRRLRQHGTRTTGTIIDYDDGPVVRFLLPDNQPVTIRPSGPSKARHVRGTSIPLYYNPADPQDAVVDTPEHTMMPTLYMLLGLGFILASLLVPLLDA